MKYVPVTINVKYFMPQNVSYCTIQNKFQPSTKGQLLSISVSYHT